MYIVCYSELDAYCNHAIKRGYISIKILKLLSGVTSKVFKLTLFPA